MEWSAEVWATYYSLYEQDQLAASNYLDLQWRLDFDPAYLRSVRLPVEKCGKHHSQAMRAAIVAILHPYQQPLSAQGVQVEMATYGLRPLTDDPIRRLCGRLVEEGQLKQLRSPFKHQILYCHEMWRAEVSEGDQVVELMRKRAHRSGVVEYFKLYRPRGRKYPVVRWDEVPGRPAFSSFANPDSLMVVGRSAPFERRAV